MKSAWPLAAVAGALALPSIASARPVTLDTQLSSYGGGQLRWRWRKSNVPLPLIV